MATESSDPVHAHDAADAESVEMPRPTVAPLVLALGVVLLALGLIAGTLFLIVGAVILFTGLGMWVGQLLPGRGHFHEALVEPSQRPRPITGQTGTVQHLEGGMPGYRLRLPEKVHPISAGIKGGLVGGAVMVLPALAFGLLSGRGLWYAVNLLAGMALPNIGEGMTTAELDQYLSEFHGGLLLAGVVLHVTMVLILGMIYGVLLPTLPSIPQALAWAALLAPVLWTAVSYALMGMVNPELRAGVSWPWFILSQFVYGVVMALIVTQATGLSPVMRGIAGGLAGGLLMALPATLWAVGTGRGLWYPVNLLAGMLTPGLNDPTDPTLSQFHAGWLAQALIMHLVLSVGFAVACALLLPKLRPIPGPMAWGGLVLPMLWTGTSYGLMGVVNPLLQERVDWFWFIVSQFVFGVVSAYVVLRSEQVYIPPAGQGPDRLADFVAGP